MKERIAQLESIARQLEPTAQQRARVSESVHRYTEDFLNRIYEIPAYVTTEDKGSGLSSSPITESPADIDSLLEIIRHNVDRPSLNPASGGHLGYIPGGGIYYASLGDYLADITNRFAGVFYASPGAVRMEHLLLEWIAEVIGYPKSAAGNLTSGGSIANLVGIVAARDARKLSSSDIPKSVIYLTSQAHHSVDKAIRIAGLKECVVRFIPVDRSYRMDANALEKQITLDTSSHLNPWLIIASAGTTDVGAVDPLSSIADIAEAHKLWLHVDGAYGGFFVLTGHGKNILRGIERSHSVVLDPHKGLFLPYGTGTVLVKDRKSLYDAFWYQANYLQDALNASDEHSPADLSPELTKHFRGMRFWLPLKLLGVAPFRAALEEKLYLARYAYEDLRTSKGFEVGPYPDLSVVTFRYVPRRGDPNEFNARLIQEILRDGRIFLSSTILDGVYTLRIAVLCLRTHLQTIETALSLLKEKAAQLEQQL